MLRASLNKTFPSFLPVYVFKILYLSVFMIFLQVLLHEPAEMVFPGIDGLWVGPGLSASIAIERSSVNILANIL